MNNNDKKIKDSVKQKNNNTPLNERFNYISANSDAGRKPIIPNKNNNKNK